MASEKVVFQTDVEDKIARKFDKIASDNFRSRAAHLNFIIEKEVEFHEAKAKE